MVIVKVASGEPAVKIGYNHGDEDITREERVLLQSFPSNEFDESERAEVDCELAMFRGQMCNIPYGLYDLPELTEVLSLEIWNLCLTEDDRFHLAACLPGLDQHDFFTTMKELFSGDALLFGSPLQSFFHRLNSGFYSPEVSQARELLMNFQRRRHYHLLRLYHNGMVEKFASMARPLRSSGVSASPGEMAPISQYWGYKKSSPCAGLSSSTLPISIKSEAATFPLLKRVKLMDETLSTHGSSSTMDNESFHVAKSMETKSESQVFHPFSEPRQNYGGLPKSVLKVTAGCATHTDRSECIHHTPELILVDQLGMQSSSFCTPPHVLHGFSENLSSHINTTRNAFSSSQSSPWQWKGALEPFALMARSPFGSQMMVPEGLKTVYPTVVSSGFYEPAANRNLAYSSEACGAREFPHVKNLLKNLGRQNNSIHESSPDPYTRLSDGHQMTRYVAMHSSRNAESISEMLNLSTRIYPLCSSSSRELETMHDFHDVLKQKAPPAKSVGELEEAHRFPYTYSRRKPRKNLDIVDSVTSSTMVKDTASPTVLASMANMKAKAVKL